MLAAMAFGLYAARGGRDFQAGLWLCFPGDGETLFRPLLFLYPAWRLRWRYDCRRRRRPGRGAGGPSGRRVRAGANGGVLPDLDKKLSPSRVWGAGTDRSRAAELTAMGGTDNQFAPGIHFTTGAITNSGGINARRRPCRPTAKRYYAIGAVAVSRSNCVVMGLRRQDSPRDLLISAGLLMGLALVVSPGHP